MHKTLRPSPVTKGGAWFCPRIAQRLESEVYARFPYQGRKMGSGREVYRRRSRRVPCPDTKARLELSEKLFSSRESSFRHTLGVTLITAPSNSSELLLTQVCI
jgi:hypothetical protein